MDADESALQEEQGVYLLPEPEVVSKFVLAGGHLTWQPRRVGSGPPVPWPRLYIMLIETRVILLPWNTHLAELVVSWLSVAEYLATWEFAHPTLQSCVSEQGGLEKTVS
jgi:hypothetical protein